MNFAFAYLPGALDGAIYMQGAEEEVKVPDAPAPAPKPKPQVPPPVWDDRRIDPEVCESATRAMCRG